MSRGFQSVLRPADHFSAPCCCPQSKPPPHSYCLPESALPAHPVSPPGRECDCVQAGQHTLLCRALLWLPQKTGSGPSGPQVSHTQAISCTSGSRAPSMSWGLCTSVPGPHSPTCPVSAQMPPPRGPPLTTLQTGYLFSTSRLTLTVLPLYLVYCPPPQAMGKVLFTAVSPVPGAVLSQSALRDVSQLSG